MNARDKSTKLRSMPFQYFIGKKYRHQYMYICGKGQQNVQSFNNTHSLDVGNYMMMVELEVPNDEMNGKEI
jgi:hypothetical protein